MLPDIREQFTLADRKQLQLDIAELRHLILPLLLQRQGYACNICHEPVENYDIDHIVYHPQVTINELQALCIPCHKAKTDFRPLRNRHK